MRDFTHKKGDIYHITGKLVNGKRFKIVINNPFHALAINLYKGSVWQVRNGKRKLVKRAVN